MPTALVSAVSGFLDDKLVLSGGKGRRLRWQRGLIRRG
jgi:hypothetical protein